MSVPFVEASYLASAFFFSKQTGFVHNVLVLSAHSHAITGYCRVARRGAVGIGTAHRHTIVSAPVRVQYNLTCPWPKRCPMSSQPITHIG